MILFFKEKLVNSWLLREWETLFFIEHRAGGDLSKGTEKVRTEPAQMEWHLPRAQEALDPSPRGLVGGDWGCTLGASQMVP